MAEDCASVLQNAGQAEEAQPRVAEKQQEDSHLVIFRETDVLCSLSLGFLYLPREPLPYALASL